MEHGLCPSTVLKCNKIHNRECMRPREDLGLASNLVDFPNALGPSRILPQTSWQLFPTRADIKCEEYIDHATHKTEGFTDPRAPLMDHLRAALKDSWVQPDSSPSQGNYYAFCLDVSGMLELYDHRSL